MTFRDLAMKAKSKLQFLDARFAVQAEVISTGNEMADAILALLDDQAKRERELLDENEQLKRLIYVPGLWKCAKCNFQLVQANLNAGDGSVTARDQPGDKCLNCNSPLWRVTERQAGNEMIDRCDEMIARHKDERDELVKALEEARHTIKVLHGPAAWDIYAHNAPEMKLIDAILDKVKKRTSHDTLYENDLKARRLV